MKLNMSTFAKERKFYTRTNLIDKLIRFVKNSAVKGLASHTLLCFGSDSKKDEDLVRARHGKDNLKMILGGDY
jgi:hypothetical protein